MVKHRKTFIRKHSKGQGDHVDAWLMSYADMITLLFMLFVIFVSVSVAKQHQQSQTTALSAGEPEHPTLTSNHSGMMALQTQYDALYRALVGIITLKSMDQDMALEKTDHGVWIDMSTLPFFAYGTVDIPQAQMAMLKIIAHTLKENMPPEAMITVEGYTDDTPLKDSLYADNWELSAVRAARIVSLLAKEGIAPARLHATSYAGTHPLVPNVDVLGKPIAQNRTRNQRIVIKVEMQ